MKIKNYLVKSLYEVKDPNWLIRDRSQENDLFPTYLDMHRTSVRSFTKNLAKEYELKFFSGKVDSISQAFEKTFWAIHDLWHSEPCNILYTDPDTVARRPFNPWELNGFMMFNFTDPKTFTSPNKYNKQFPYFFNAGVRYFGHDMNKDVWKVGADMARDWDHSTYDTEQIILNSMLWSQPIGLDDVLKPVMAYQAHGLPETPVWLHDVWNGLAFDSSCIVHVHGSRNAAVKLDIMKQFIA